MLLFSSISRLIPILLSPLVQGLGFRVQGLGFGSNAAILKHLPLTPHPPAPTSPALPSFAVGSRVPELSTIVGSRVPKLSIIVGSRVLFCRSEAAKLSPHVGEGLSGSVHRHLDRV